MWNSDGWLASIGFVDFAGSGVVHLTGAVAALAAVVVTGPRSGKYNRDGTPREIPGHSLTLGALGVFILWFGWYGFNGGSTLAAVGADIGSVVVTTTLAPAAGAVAAMFTAWLVVGKPDVGLTLNGALGGLVGITAGAAAIPFGASLLVGLIAGVIVVLSIRVLERIGIDDPVGAISVHGAAGIWGVVAVGVFGGANVGVQVLGVLAIVSWVLMTSFVVFRAIDRLHGMRVSPEEELSGLDASEHGGEAYPEFAFANTDGRGEG